MSRDFKDAYFHIPLQNQSRKYLRLHVQGKTYQFKALPFGLSTAPLEFTVMTKEVNLMALQKGIGIHHYLEDWLVQARSHQTCLQHTQTLVAFYCVNTSYPMDNSLSGRRRPARQTSEKDVLCFHRPGRSSTVHSQDGVSYFLPVETA